VCQVCGKNKSFRINRFGPIKACCIDCLNKEQQNIKEQMFIESGAE
jgi:hypothetical protein